MGAIGVPAFFVLIFGLLALFRPHLLGLQLAAHRKTIKIVTVAAGVVMVVAVALDPVATSPPPVAAPAPATTTATTAATTTVTPTPTTTTVVVAPPPVVTSTVQPTTTTTTPAAPTTTTAVAPRTANTVVSAATLDRMHGHCINFTDRQIIAAAQYSSGDLAKHGQDESPESVASHVADATQSGAIDCQSTFATYLVLREGG